MSTRRRGRHTAAPVILILLVWLVSAVPAAAHSELVSSIPAAGSTVTAVPGFSVVLSFSEALKIGSKADIVGPSGTTAGTATIEATDNTKLAWSPAAALPPGSYTIRWTSIATDGDLLRGTIPFVVTAATVTAPAATPSPSPVPGAVSTAGVGAIVPVVAAVIVIGALALVLLRNRRPAGRR